MSKRPILMISKGHGRGEDHQKDGKIKLERTQIFHYSQWKEWQRTASNGKGVWKSLCEDP